MPKFTDDELKEWFANPNCCQLSKSDNHSTENLVKIPYENDFDLLFYNHTWHEKNIALDAKLESAGLYYRKNGCIYYPLENQNFWDNKIPPSPPIRPKIVRYE